MPTIHLDETDADRKKVTFVAVADGTGALPLGTRLTSLNWTPGTWSVRAARNGTHNATAISDPVEVSATNEPGLWAIAMPDAFHQTASGAANGDRVDVYVDCGGSDNMTGREIQVEIKLNNASIKAKTDQLTFTGGNLHADLKAWLAAVPAALDGSGWVAARVKGCDNSSIHADAHTADAQERLFGIVHTGGVSLGATATSMQLTSGPATADIFNGCIAHNVGTKSTALITDYAADGTVTMAAPGLVVVPGVESTIVIVRFKSSDINATAIADSILDTVLDTGRTVRGFFRRAYAHMFGANTGLSASGTVTAYKSDGTTPEYTVVQDIIAGTRSAAGSE